MENLKITRALLSVTDKTGLIKFASFLAASGVEIVSTGGTQKMLAEAGLAVMPVSSVTGFPEILNGRVKTLHPAIHAGILANKDNPEHMDTLASLDIHAFDLVCVNLYNFKAAVASKASFSDTIEQIDIGGPCLLRAAAKNFQSVLVLPDPVFYRQAADEMENNNMQASLEFRKEMARHTFERTSTYDAAIAEYLKN